MMLPFIFLHLTVNYEVLAAKPKHLDASADKPSLLVPSDFMTHETQWLLQALEQAHFEKVDVDDLNTSVFIEEFLNNLDKRKLFFTSTDLQNYLSRYQPTLITYLKQGNLFPGFEIYRDYKEKSLNRISWSINFLTKNPIIDSNESIELNEPEEVTWSNDLEGLNSKWIKLITHEYINELLSQLDDNITNLIDKNILGSSKEKARLRLIKKYERWGKNIDEFEATDLQEIYLSTLTQQFDPHTSFLNIKEKEKFDQTMQNEFVGIGAVLTDEDGFCTIKELLPGGPAEASRELEPEDIILKVSQGEEEFIDVVDMRLSKIVELIKGPKDTLVRLLIKPINDPSSSKTVNIIRDRVKLTANLASSSLHQVFQNESDILVGTIELPSFYGSNGKGNKATDDVEELINNLKKEGAQGLILDLRRNGGGYLSEAVNLAGLFISRGPVVQVKSTDGKIRKKFDFNPKLAWDGPLIILVSRYSASASEIVAGALKNHRRAIIVGDCFTHGKGTVQSLLPMNSPFHPSSINGKKSAAKITIQKYYLPSGESTQLSGVKSDISMSSINEFLPIGEGDLKNALSWDKIGSVNFKRPSSEFRYDDLTLDLLRKKSHTRQSKSSEFKYLNENIDWFQERRKKQAASLNLNQRIKEKLLDQNRSKDLESVYNSLTSKSYPVKNLVLDIVRQQEIKSKEVRGEKPEESQALLTFEQPDSLDIRLHESIRIMTDWIEILNQNTSPKETAGSSRKI